MEFGNQHKTLFSIQRIPNQVWNDLRDVTDLPFSDDKQLLVNTFNEVADTSIFYRTTRENECLDLIFSPMGLMTPFNSNFKWEFLEQLIIDGHSWHGEKVMDDFPTQLRPNPFRIDAYCTSTGDISFNNNFVYRQYGPPNKKANRRIVVDIGRDNIIDTDGSRICGWNGQTGFHRLRKIPPQYPAISTSFQRPMKDTDFVTDFEKTTKSILANPHIIRALKMASGTIRSLIFTFSPAKERSIFSHTHTQAHNCVFPHKPNTNRILQYPTFPKVTHVKMQGAYIDNPSIWLNHQKFPSLRLLELHHVVKDYADRHYSSEWHLGTDVVNEILSNCSQLIALKLYNPQLRLRRNDVASSDNNDALQTLVLPSTIEYYYSSFIPESNNKGVLDISKCTKLKALITNGQ